MESNNTIKIILTIAVLFYCLVLQQINLMACEISSSETIINNGKEYPNGVPNYAMDSFGDKNDCGVLSATILLGYWDANNWPCMLKGQPYDNNSVSNWAGSVSNWAGINNVYSVLENALPYDSTFGTWDANTLVPTMDGAIGSIIANQACKIANPNAINNYNYDCWWLSEDNEDVKKQNIRSNIRKSKPLMLLARINGIDVKWYDDIQERDGYEETIRFHWMPVLGFKDVTEGSTVLGTCFDYLNPDEFYMTLRSAWRQGGDSKIVYNWWALDNLYTVSLTPRGDISGDLAKCNDYISDADGDGYYSDTAPAGMTAGADCNDNYTSIHPGAFEQCNYKDDNCNGQIDEGVNDIDGDGTKDACDNDRDGDGKYNYADNCPDNANPSQEDLDHDGKGDVCDTDRDGDSKLNNFDNCPDVANNSQNDIDNDNKGDVCDNDKDGDGFNNINDNCPDVHNRNQIYNPSNPDFELPPDYEYIRGSYYYQMDSDNDGLGNKCDNCSFVSNPDQKDLDHDGLGNVCDNDRDGDGTINSADSCPDDRYNNCIPSSSYFSGFKFSRFRLW